MIKTPNRLFTEILNSDFSIIKVNKKTSFQNKSQTRLKLQYGSHFDALDLLVLQQSLKQFIKSLRFLSKSSLRSNITFYTNNLIVQDLVGKLFKNCLQGQILVENSFKNIKKKFPWERKLIIILNVKLMAPILSQFLKHDIFLLYKINSTKETKQLGIYKIFNQLNELKKMLFFLILIRRVFKQFFKKTYAKIK